jgi:hypothetical protein
VASATIRGLLFWCWSVCCRLAYQLSLVMIRRRTRFAPAPEPARMLLAQSDDTFAICVCACIKAVVIDDLVVSLGALLGVYRVVQAPELRGFETHTMTGADESGREVRIACRCIHVPSRALVRAMSAREFGVRENGGDR